MTKNRIVLLLFALYTGVFLTRVLLIMRPPTGFFYNIDELEMTLSCLDRFTGVPPTSLQWPGSILQMLFLPILGLDFILHSGLGGGTTVMLGNFAAYVSHAYANPVHIVVLLRLLVVAISSAAPVFAFLIAGNLNNSFPAAWICSGIVTFAPVFTRQSAMAMGEACAVTFALAAIYFALRNGARGAIWAGVLFAAALAARITTAALIVLPVLLLAFESAEPPRHRAASIGRFLTGTVVGFLFFCPYSWTEPVRFAKALLGHLHQKPVMNGSAFLRTWVDAMGISFSVIAILSLIALLTGIFVARRKGVAAAALLAMLTVSMPLLSSGNDIFPRYFLPLLPCSVLLTALALSADFHRPHLRRLLMIVFSCGIAGMVIETSMAEAAIRRPDDLASGLDAARELAGVNSLYLPQDALYLYRIPLSGAVYRRMRDRSSTQLRDHSGLLEFLQLRGIPSTAANALLTDFTEDEQARDARLAAASQSSSEVGSPLFFYFDPSEIHGIVAQRLTPADYTIDEAIHLFKCSTHSAILVVRADSRFGEPVWRGTHEWFLYRH